MERQGQGVRGRQGHRRFDHFIYEVKYGAEHRIEAAQAEIEKVTKWRPLAFRLSGREAGHHANLAERTPRSTAPPDGLNRLHRCYIAF